jgi:hypothetical protein
MFSEVLVFSTRRYANSTGVPVICGKRSYKDLPIASCAEIPVSFSKPSFQNVNFSSLLSEKKASVILSVKMRYWSLESVILLSC